MIDRSTLNKRRRDDDALQPVARDTSPLDDARLRQTSPPANSSARGLRNAHNNVDIAQRTADDSPNTENRSQMSTGSAGEEIEPEFLDQAERMTRGLERDPSFKYLGFLTDPAQREEYVRGLAQMLRESAGGRPKRRPAQVQNKRDDLEFLDGAVGAEAYKKTKLL